MWDDDLKRYKELKQYFKDYRNGKFDEDDTLLDELSMELSELEKEISKSE